MPEPYATLRTESGIEIPINRPPDLVVEFEDPGTPELRTKQFQEIADGMFDLNGIKRYRATVGGGKCLLEGWGEQL